MCLYLVFDHTVVACGGENNHKSINISDCMTKPEPGHLAITSAVIQSNIMPYKNKLCHKATNEEMYVIHVKSTATSKHFMVIWFLDAWFLFLHLSTQITLLLMHIKYHTRMRRD